MLVECTAFAALGKIQPFLVSMSTNAMLLMDFHCHLTTSEVCGYLAGQWDVNAHSKLVRSKVFSYFQNFEILVAPDLLFFIAIVILFLDLSVTHVFPCRSRLDDQTNGPLVEKEVQKEIENHGLIPVGWYHSHPMLPASPSLRDIDKQLDHEMHMKGTSDSCYTPCIAVICCMYY